MTINDISKELGLTKRAIKFYEEKGLLSVPKDENGYRNYSQEHIRILKTISVYRKLGIGITDIQKIINHGDESILLQVLVVDIWTFPCIWLTLWILIRSLKYNWGILNLNDFQTANQYWFAVFFERQF